MGKTFFVYQLNASTSYIFLPLCKVYLPVVDAFADLVLRDDLAVLASVLLALVRRIPDGAGHSDGAESLGSVANRRRRRLALLRNVALHLQRGGERGYERWEVLMRFY